MYVDLAVVVPHDAVDDGQAEAGAAAFGRKVREKELVLVGIGDAAAGIGDLDDHAVRGAAGGDPDLARLGRLDGVLQQVPDRAADLFGVHQQLDVGGDVDR